MKLAKNLAFIAGVITTIVVVNSCQTVKTEHSQTLHEDAVVVTLIYSPSQHNTELTNTMYDNGSMVGTDYDGNTGIKVGKNLQITSTTIPERHGVVFQCKHGTFTIEGEALKYKVLHDKMARSVGDTVDILYQEEFRVTYEDVDDKNMKTANKLVETSRVLNRMDFIDAQIKVKK